MTTTKTTSKTTKKNSKVKAKRLTRTPTKKVTWKATSYTKIEKVRSKLGITKTAIAEALGVSNGTYHNWKRGTTVPHLTQQEAIRDCLITLVAANNDSDLIEVDTTSPSNDNRTVSGIVNDAVTVSDIAQPVNGGVNGVVSGANGNSHSCLPDLEVDARRTPAPARSGTVGGNNLDEQTIMNDSLSTHAPMPEVLRDLHVMDVTARITIEFIKSNESLSAGSIISFVKEIRAAIS